MIVPGELLAFWRDAGMGKWFRGGDDFDAECRARWLDAHFAAARRAFDDWMDAADSALALVLLLDQIPRNVFRKSGHAFATDPLALHYAGRAIDAGFDAQVDPSLRFFFYLPFEHSEAIADQDRAVDLFTALGNADLLGYANAHRDVIVRFGRFPHRNAPLGRNNTADEQAWLEAGGGF
ncbi:MAG TPA: DUF924 family protein [Thermomonas sp.]|jgi:uncharacterized protein (DUF924 family)|nr:DUF924 family protein [Thermomonas sp.]HPW13776.1 DUF924 family protein [Thermomonas sp.]